MTWNTKRLPGTLALLVVIAALGPGTRSARAQSGTSTTTGTGLGMGMGMAMGMGMGGFHYASSPTDYLNQRARLNAGRRGAPATQGSMAANPNAYYNRVRDDSFVPHYARRSGQTAVGRSQHPGSPADQVDRRPPSESTAASSRPREVIPLSNFFDSSGKLVWPGEAPAEAGLKEQRAVFERASLAALEESREHGSASIATVTAARQKLLDYGRPALQQVRASSSPDVADKFHRFLLSVYDSLARSAAPPEATPGSASKP